MKKYVILFIIVFSICVISVVTSTAFFSKNTSVTGDVTLGDLDFTVYADLTSATKIMPADTLECPVYLVNARDTDGINTTNLSPIYVRFSAELISNNETATQSLLVNNNDNFTVINDTYYYLNVINPADRIVLVDSFYFDENLPNSFSSKDAEIIITVDAIQGNIEAVQDLWPEFYNIIA